MCKIVKGFFITLYKSKQVDRHKIFWGRGYGAFSVSASQVDNVINYIKNQEEHHTLKSFNEEYKMFIEKYGLKYDVPSPPSSSDDG